MPSASLSSKFRNTKREPTASAPAGCSRSRTSFRCRFRSSSKARRILPGHAGGMSEAPSPAYVADFLATSDGLSLTKAFMRIKSSKLRRRIVDLVEQIAGMD
mgnify:CR=1 FL=1